MVKTEATHKRELFDSSLHRQLWHLMLVEVRQPQACPATSTGPLLRPSPHLYLKRPLASGALSSSWPWFPDLHFLGVCYPGTALRWGQHVLLVLRQKKVPVWRNWVQFPPEELLQERWGQQKKKAGQGGPVPGAQERLPPAPGEESG